MVAGLSGMVAGGVAGLVVVLPAGDISGSTSSSAGFMVLGPAGAVAGEVAPGVVSRSFTTSFLSNLPRMRTFSLAAGSVPYDMPFILYRQSSLIAYCCEMSSMVWPSRTKWWVICPPHWLRFS